MYQDGRISSYGIFGSWVAGSLSTEIRNDTQVGAGSLSTEAVLTGRDAVNSNKIGDGGEVRDVKKSGGGRWERQDFQLRTHN